MTDPEIYSVSAGKSHSLFYLLSNLYLVFIFLQSLSPLNFYYLEKFLSFRIEKKLAKRQHCKYCEDFNIEYKNYYWC